MYMITLSRQSASIPDPTKCHDEISRARVSWQQNEALYERRNGDYTILLSPFLPADV